MHVEVKIQHAFFVIDKLVQTKYRLARIVFNKNVRGLLKI